MNSQRFIKNILRVTISNGIRLLSSILVGLIIPIIFSVDNYGYYKLYTLYVTYFGLFHFGFIDGIYLKYGGKSFESLDKSKFKLYTKFLFCLELAVAFIIIIVSLLFLQGERQVVFLVLGINVIALNLLTYYQFIAQITSRFKEYSYRSIIYAVLVTITVGIVYFFNIANYKFLIICLVIVNYILAIWYSKTYKQLVFGKSDKIRNNKRELFEIVKLGVPLLIANLLTTFMMNFSKQLVDWKYSIEVFAVFSFAYSLMNFANVFISATSTVVYPTLKKIDNRKLNKYYSDSISAISIIVLLSLALYYPLEYFVGKYIVKYIDSIHILRIVFPGLIFTSAIQIVKLNYFKTLNLLKEYLKTGLIAFVILIVLSYSAYMLFNTLEAIAYSSVLSFLIWYIITDIYFIKKYRIKPLINLMFIVLSIIIFYLTYEIKSIFFSLGAYLIILVILILVFHSKLIKRLYLSYKTRRRNNVNNG